MPCASTAAFAGYHPEAHFYVKGGHGFGMTKQSSTSDHFIEEFRWWMQAIGMAPKGN